jgi:hypothetical protein
MDRSPLYAFALLFLATLIAQGAPDKLTLRWDQLPAAMAGGTTRVRVHGVTLDGRIVSTSEESMQMMIEHSSDSKGYGRGVTSLTRAEIELIYLIHRRIRGRIIGTAAGIFAPAAAIGATAGKYQQENELWGLLILATGAIGYQLGKIADTQRIEIVILP